MMTLILWESNESLYPSDPEERMKLIMSMIERTKKSIESGATKLWGLSAAGGRGFSITENEPKEIFARLTEYSPYIKFELIPMLSIDEVIDTMKSMQQ